MSLRSSWLVLGVAVSPLGAFLACSSDNSEAPAATDGTDDVVDAGKTTTKKKDSGAKETTDAGDAASDDSGLTAFDESEPNNGSALDAGGLEVNAFAAPGVMNGVLSPAKDIDAFQVDVSIGEVWTWELTPSSALAPYLGITDNYPSKDPNGAPSLLQKGAAGETLVQEQFALGSRPFYAIVADTRNLFEKGSFGGATFTYALSATKSVRTPTALKAPQTIKTTLKSRGAIDLYAFSTAGSKGWDIDIRANRKAPASDMDSRVSIYDSVAKKWLFVNDDITINVEPDSHVGSSAATGSYIVIVENVAEAPTDLSYEIELALR